MPYHQKTLFVDNDGDPEGADLYNIAQLTYPLDLMEATKSNKYSGNRVVFFINVNESSQGFAPKGSPNYDLHKIPESDLKNSSGIKLSTVLTKTPIVGEAKKRLAAAIVLYMPNALAQDTSVVWGEEELDNPANLATVGIASVHAGYKGDGASGVLNAAGNLAYYGTGLALIKSNLLGAANLAAATSRITPGNTRAEQLFKRVTFRSFNMLYNFAPKSEAEAANVLSIIRMFKHHMLPEYKDTATFLFLYPSDFNIKYYVGDKENQYLEKNFTCVLTNISINYSPNGIFSTFPNGMPTMIDLTMSFTELSLATKETVPGKAPEVKSKPYGGATGVIGANFNKGDDDASGIFVPDVLASPEGG